MFKLLYPHAYVESVFSIDFKELYDKGYRAIIFDIDNTLVHHGDDSTEQVDDLFKYIHKIGLKTFLLTDNDEERVKRFIKNIDTLYICEANKPKTYNYFRAVEMLGMNKEKIIFVGDQIFTDILGANRSGIDNILVKFIQLEGETKIGKKRYLEKIILKLYKKNKKLYNRLDMISK